MPDPQDPASDLRKKRLDTKEFSAHVQAMAVNDLICGSAAWPGVVGPFSGRGCTVYGLKNELQTLDSEVASFGASKSQSDRFFASHNFANSMRALSEQLSPFALAPGFVGAQSSSIPKDLAEAYGFLAAPRIVGRSRQPSRLETLAILAKTADEKSVGSKDGSLPPAGKVAWQKWQQSWAEARPGIERVLAHPTTVQDNNILHRQVEMHRDPAEWLMKVVKESQEKVERIERNKRDAVRHPRLK